MWNIIVRLASYTRFLKEKKERYYSDLLTYFTTDWVILLPLDWPPQSSSPSRFDHSAIVVRPPRSSSRAIILRFLPLDFARFAFFSPPPPLPPSPRAEIREQRARPNAVFAVAVDWLPCHKTKRDREGEKMQVRYYFTRKDNFILQLTLSRFPRVKRWWIYHAFLKRRRLSFLMYLIRLLLKNDTSQHDSSKIEFEEWTWRVTWFVRK